MSSIDEIDGSKLTIEGLIRVVCVKDLFSWINVCLERSEQTDLYLIFDVRSVQMRKWKR